MKRLWTSRNAVLIYVLCFSAGALSAIVLTRRPVLEYIATPQFLGIATAGSSLVALLIALLGRAWSEADREQDRRLRATPLAVELVDAVRRWRAEVNETLEGCWERTFPENQQAGFEDNILEVQEWTIPAVIREGRPELWVLGSAARPIYCAIRAVGQLNHAQQMFIGDPSYEEQVRLALESAKALPGLLDAAMSSLEALAES